MGSLIPMLNDKRMLKERCGGLPYPMSLKHERMVKERCDGLPCPGYPVSGKDRRQLGSRGLLSAVCLCRNAARSLRTLFVE